MDHNYLTGLLLKIFSIPKKFCSDLLTIDFKLNFTEVKEQAKYYLKLLMLLVLFPRLS